MKVKGMIVGLGINDVPFITVDENLIQFKLCLNQLNKKGFHFSMKPFVIFLWRIAGSNR